MQGAPDSIHGRNSMHPEIPARLASPDDRQFGVDGAICPAGPPNDKMPILGQNRNASAIDGRCSGNSG